MTDTTRKIPVLQPTFGDVDAILDRCRELFRTRQITLGRFTRELESQVGKYLGVEHVIAVSSCTSGLMIALRALELEGDVIVPTFTFGASAHALAWCGLKPVFCDCDEGSLTVGAKQVRSLVTERTTAIMPVYIFGTPPDWDGIGEVAAEYGLGIVADAAQGLGSTFGGARCGGFGDVEVFSMSPTKVVTAGEGGLLTTNNADLAGRIRRLRDYGKSEDGEDMTAIGLSARMSEFHAVIAVENFRCIDDWLVRRRDRIELYQRELVGLPGLRFPVVPDETTSSWNYMVILVDPATAPFDRDRLHANLREQGIQTKRYFFPPVHRLSVYRGRGPEIDCHLPVSERIAARALALPLYTHMSEDDVRTVCRAIRSLA